MTNIRPDRLLIPLAVVVAAWWYLLHGAGMPAAMPEMPGMSAMASPSALLVMWIVMMAAMMLPSAAPGIARYGTLFALGYVLVWTVFGAAASLLQVQLDRTGALSDAMALHSAPLAALIVLAAGAYELSPLKGMFLRRCRPESGPAANPLATGLRQGVFCIGCCWTLMALLFVAGVMNVVAMAAISLLVLAEKVLPLRLSVDRIAGVALVLCAGFIGWRAFSA